MYLFKGLGVRTIRALPFLWRFFQPTGPDEVSELGFTETVFDGNPKYVASLDDVVQTCTELDMYVIVTLECTSYNPAPQWAQDLGCPGHGRFAIWDWALAGSENAQTCLRGIRNTVVSIVRRYPGNVRVILNVFNEPSIQDLDPSVGAANYKAFMESCVAAIRANESVAHYIVVPEYFGLRDMGLTDNIVGDGRVYRDTHFYWPFEQPYDHSQYASLENDFQKRINALTNTGLKLMVGEFGRRIDPLDGGSLEWIMDAYDVFEKHGVVDVIWHAWSHAPGIGYTLLDSSNKPIEPYYSAVMSGLYVPPTPTFPFWSLLTRIVGPIGVGLYFLGRSTRRG